MLGSPSARARVPPTSLPQFHPLPVPNGPGTAKTRRSHGGRGGPHCQEDGQDGAEEERGERGGRRAARAGWEVEGRPGGERRPRGRDAVGPRPALEGSPAGRRQPSWRGKPAWTAPASGRSVPGGGPAAPRLRALGPVLGTCKSLVVTAADLNLTEAVPPFVVGVRGS